MSILIFIVILLVLVLVHEFGHFFTAKRFGIRVDEFGFGFPPKLFSRKYGETEYSFNLFPLGGFVKIFGENPDEENTNGPNSGRSFINKPKWKQAIVLFAGIFANFLLAWLLFSFTFMSGFPTSVGAEAPGAKLTDVHLVITSVADKSPAQIAGFEPGDKIISVQSGKDNLSEINTDTLKSFVLAHGIEIIKIGYLRGENTAENFIKVIPQINVDNGAPMIGISIDEIGIEKMPVLRAFKEGMIFNLSVAQNTFSGLYTLIKEAILGRGSLESITGPVGLVGIVGDVSHLGFAYLISFTGLISVNLAIINLIPFPALDGGRLLFLLIEKIKGSRINPKITNTVNTIGFAILIIFMIIVTYHDIIKLR